MPKTKKCTVKNCSRPAAPASREGRCAGHETQIAGLRRRNGARATASAAALKTAPCWKKSIDFDVVCVRKRNHDGDHQGPAGVKLLGMDPYRWPQRTATAVAAAAQRMSTTPSVYAEWRSIEIEPAAPPKHPVLARAFEIARANLEREKAAADRAHQQCERWRGVMSVLVDPNVDVAAASVPRE